MHRTSNPLVLDSVSSGLKKCFHHPVSSVRLPGFYVCNALVQLFIWQAAIECFDWKIELIHASEYCASWHSQNFSNGWDGQVQFQKTVKMMGERAILSRPVGPHSNWMTALCRFILSFSLFIRVCKLHNASKRTGQTWTWPDKACRKTSSWVQMKSKKSRSRGKVFKTMF